MPWEEILESLQRNCEDRDLSEIAHPEAAMKYMLRVHLQVNAVDFKKHLQQIMVRPFVLIALLDFLIDRNHEVFRGKGSAQELRAKVREAVHREYPETEGDKPEAERVGHIPPSIEALLDEREKGREDALPERPKKKLRLLSGEKNATPGDGARSVHECLDNVRPQAICVDKSSQASTDPGTQREGGLERQGELNIKTGGKPISQYESKYFSQVLPLVLPYMCSGPDFFPHKRWRRNLPDAPLVTPEAFLKNFGRQVLAQCRSDWSALPVIRNVVFRWQAEHTMAPIVTKMQKDGKVVKLEVSDLVNASKRLYEVLHNGFTGKGTHRVPIAGDVTRLPFATGLAP